MHFISVLENIKIYIKSYIKIAATCFGLLPSSGSLHMSLAKVTFIKSVKVSPYGLCGCVAAFSSMLSHNRIVHLINVTLARLICKLPNDGRRPKHVGAILI